MELPLRCPQHGKTSITAHCRGRHGTCSPWGMLRTVLPSLLVTMSLAACASDVHSANESKLHKNGSAQYPSAHDDLDFEVNDDVTKNAVYDLLREVDQASISQEAQENAFGFTWDIADVEITSGGRVPPANPESSQSISYKAWVGLEIRRKESVIHKIFSGFESWNGFYNFLQSEGLELWSQVFLPLNAARGLFDAYDYFQKNGLDTNSSKNGESTLSQNGVRFGVQKATYVVDPDYAIDVEKDEIGYGPGGWSQDWGNAPSCTYVRTPSFRPIDEHGESVTALALSANTAWRTDGSTRTTARHACFGLRTGRTYFDDVSLNMQQFGAEVGRALLPGFRENLCPTTTLACMAAGAKRISEIDWKALLPRTSDGTTLTPRNNGSLPGAGVSRDWRVAAICVLNYVVCNSLTFTSDFEDLAAIDRGSSLDEYVNAILSHWPLGATTQALKEANIASNDIKFTINRESSEPSASVANVVEQDDFSGALDDDSPVRLACAQLAASFLEAGHMVVDRITPAVISVTDGFRHQCHLGHGFSSIIKRCGDWCTTSLRSEYSKPSSKCTDICDRMKKNAADLEITVGDQNAYNQSVSTTE